MAVESLSSVVAPAPAELTSSQCNEVLDGPLAGAETSVQVANSTVAATGESGLYELNTRYSVLQDESWLSYFFRRPTEEKTYNLITGVEKDGKIWVETADGYLLRFDNKDMRWKITAPDGQTTTIWGDPHVNESDGTHWDFTHQSTFVFGKNRVTVETVPSGNGNTYTGTVHIYSGNERVTITDIDKNAIRYQGWKQDGRVHDKATADGDVYVLVNNPNGGFEWQRQASR